MSVVLVCFPGAPKISEEAVKKEEELDKFLETRVEGQHQEHAHTERLISKISYRNHQNL